MRRNSSRSRKNIDAHQGDRGDAAELREGLRASSRRARAADLVEDALRMNERGLRPPRRRGRRANSKTVPPVAWTSTRCCRSSINLMRNAKYACRAMLGRRDKTASTVRIAQRRRPRARSPSADNGVGIAPENLTRIFAHGFTTQEGRPRLRPAQRRARREGNGRRAHRAQRRPGPRRHLHPRTAAWTVTSA